MGASFTVACAVLSFLFQRILKSYIFQEFINNFLNDFTVLFKQEEFLRGVISWAIQSMTVGFCYFSPVSRKLVEIILPGKQRLLFNTTFYGNKTFRAWKINL